MDLKELSALWAPWRVEYYQAAATPDFLLEAAQATDDAAHLVVCRRKSAFLIMNKYPYAVGHMMAVPYRKVAELGALTKESHAGARPCAPAIALIDMLSSLRRHSTF